MSDSSNLRHLLRRSGAALLIIVGLFAAWSGTRVVKAWLGTDRIDYDVTAASAAIDAANEAERLAIEQQIRDAEAAADAEARAAAELEAQGQDSADGIDPAEPQGDSTIYTAEEISSFEELLAADSILPPDHLQTYLIIGSDQRPAYGEASRADVILMLIIPPDDDPIMLSLPRDLWIPNPCTGGMSRINANLNGCGDRATGPETLALAVEQYTGIHVDHFALFDFEGFKRVVDGVGGVEVCVDQATRTDWRSGAEVVFEPGCTLTNGEGALAWMRSRHTQVLNANGVWVTMPGVNDLTRNQRQQDMIIQALVKLKGYQNVTEFATVVETLTSAFTIDEGLGLWEAIALAWSQRDLNPASIERLVIPTTFYTTDGGAIVLLPTEKFQDVLARAYPNVEDLLTAGAAQEGP